jgi:KDO2-lipid IV(A) lauroyltransferase
MKKTGFVAFLTYLLTRSVTAWLQVLPLEWTLACARGFGRIWQWATPKHRDRAIKHLTASMGDELSPRQVARLADACLEQWAMFAVEVVCTGRLMHPFSWLKYVRLEGFEPALRALMSQRGVIMVTGHYGHFELTGHLLGCLGFDVYAVMRPLDNVYMNDHLVRARRSQGLKLLDKFGAMQMAEDVLRDGAALCFIADQDAGPKGVFVDFFGQPASTYKSVALLAMTAEVPILVGYARRVGSTPQYEVGVQRVIEPAEWKEQANPARWITQEYTAAIEAFVREEPSQYLWIHRRWKTKPGQRRKPRKKAKLEAATPRADKAVTPR